MKSAPTSRSPLRTEQSAKRAWSKWRPLRMLQGVPWSDPKLRVEPGALLPIPQSQHWMYIPLGFSCLLNGQTVYHAPYLSSPSSVLNDKIWGKAQKCFFVSMKFSLDLGCHSMYQFSQDFEQDRLIG